MVTRNYYIYVMYSNHQKNGELSMAQISGQWYFIDLDNNRTVL